MQLRFGLFCTWVSADAAAVLAAFTSMEKVLELVQYAQVQAEIVAGGWQMFNRDF